MPITPWWFSQSFCPSTPDLSPMQALRCVVVHYPQWCSSLSKFYLFVAWGRAWKYICFHWVKHWSSKQHRPGFAGAVMIVTVVAGFYRYKIGHWKLHNLVDLTSYFIWILCVCKVAAWISIFLLFPVMCLIHCPAFWKLQDWLILFRVSGHKLIDVLYSVSRDRPNALLLTCVYWLQLTWQSCWCECIIRFHRTASAARPGCEG